MVLEPTRFPVGRKGWILVDARGEPHVLPSIDGVAAEGHRAVRACPACRPILVRSGPLSDPVWTHDAPGWPGAEIRRPTA